MVCHVNDNPLAGVNGIPYIQLFTAVQGLRALSRGMRLTRIATPALCMGIISQVTRKKYKRTARHEALLDGEAIIEAIRRRREEGGKRLLAAVKDPDAWAVKAKRELRAA